MWKQQQKLIWNLFFYESNGCYLLSPLNSYSNSYFLLFCMVPWILIQLSAFSFFGIFGVIYFIFSLSFLFNIIQFFFYSFFVMSLLDQKMPCGGHTLTHTRKHRDILDIFDWVSFFQFFRISFSLYIWMSNNVYWEWEWKMELILNIL